MNSDMSILIIEDEPDIQELLAYNLKKNGFKTEVIGDGKSGLSYVQKNSDNIDLILLDLMLPGMSGLDVCRNIKSDSKCSHIPVIMVTAKGEENDIVLGLEVGADDYVTKPFSPKELIARVRACLRRSTIKDDPKSSNTSDSSVLSFGPIKINPESFEVFIENKAIAFTLSEFKLLRTMLLKPGKVFTRNQLLHVIAGDGTYIVDRNVDVHIRSLRKKLEKFADMIETVRGIGYKIVNINEP